jgi:ferredoxin
MSRLTRSVPRYDDPKKVEWGLVEVDATRCDGCKLCVKVCPSHCLTVEGGVSRMRIAGVSECLACSDCEAACHSGAIRLTRTYRFAERYVTLDRGPLSPPRL